jgi:ribonuclease G
MEIYYSHPSQEKIVGNIYKGRVEDVLPGLGSAFVDVGERQSLFLSRGEINDSILIEHGLEPRDGRVPINKILRSGQSILLQVRRAGIRTKNPQGTMKISLPGRYWVLLPEEDRIGLSRRITRPRVENRIRKTAHSLKSEGIGMIARTAAQWASKEELRRDYENLVQGWRRIEAAARSASVPSLLYKELGLIQTILRDRLLPDVAELTVDSKVFYDKIKQFLGYMHMERYQKKIKLHNGELPLFELYNVEEQIQATQSPRVDLDGGGFLIISETEALTAIDVNTGSDVRHRNQQAAILNTNLEATKEISRQLRLRKISGIIVVDMVDMKSQEAIQKVVDRLRLELNKDRVPTDFIDVTELGLLEITRKREEESLADMLESAEFEA